MNEADFQALASSAGIVASAIDAARAAYVDDGKQTVAAFAVAQKAEHPDWFKPTKAAPKTKFEYADPVLIVRAEAEKLGLIPDAVEKLQAQVSREVTEGKWVQVHGVPMRSEKPGDPVMTADEWLPTLEKTHPDYWPVAREKTGDDGKTAPTYEEQLAAFGPRADGKPFNEHGRNAFVTKYGEAVYRETMLRWNATDIRQAAEALPKEAADADTKAKPGKTTKAERGEDQSGNPWHPSFPEEKRQAAIVNFIKMAGTAKSVAMARAAGKMIDGRDLRQRA